MIVIAMTSRGFAIERRLDETKIIVFLPEKDILGWTDYIILHE